MHLQEEWEKIKLYSLSNFILGASTIVLNIIFIVGAKLGVTGLLWANTIANTATALIIFARLHLIQFISRKDLSKKNSIRNGKIFCTACSK